MGGHTNVTWDMYAFTGVYTTIHEGDIPKYNVYVVQNNFKRPVLLYEIYTSDDGSKVVSAEPCARLEPGGTHTFRTDCFIVNKHFHVKTVDGTSSMDVVCPAFPQSKHKLHDLWQAAKAAKKAQSA